VTHVKFHTAGRGLGEHQRSGALKRAAKQVGWTGHLESQRPPGLTARADFGEFHPAFRTRGPLRGLRHEPPACQSVPG
jgi:hypothetical protein